MRKSAAGPRFQAFPVLAGWFFVTGFEDAEATGDKPPHDGVAATTVRVCIISKGGL